MKLLIKNGKVIDPLTRTNSLCDVLIENGRILRVSKNIRSKNARVIDADRKWVIPGLVDIHTHLREPGHERKETIRTGTMAAACGGITSVLAMPNTNPITDNAPSVEYILLKADKEGVVNVFPVGAVTKGIKGLELSEIGVLFSAGIKAVSDDGMSIMNSYVMKRALEYCKQFNIPVISHAEDLNLSFDGVMNEGYTSTVLGLRGIPASSEEVMVARDIILASETGGYLHVAHVSTKGAVELIRRAKAKKVNVTCETCPHYFTLTEEALIDYNTNAKMKPPLRTKEDVAAIKKGLIDGTIDCIATDHAPHTVEEKNNEFDVAPFGIIGLETSLSLSFSHLVNKNFSMLDLLTKMSLNPSRIMNIESRGAIKEGFFADVAVFDPKAKWVVTSNFKSKSKNSPFIGMELSGVIDYTIVNGCVVYKRK